MGDGAVGLCGVIAARRLGAKQIIMLGRHPDRIALASTGDLLGMRLNTFLSGSLSGMVGNALPWAQAMGTNREKIPSR